MEIKRFFIYGITGVYNYGCEGTIRAVSKLIKEKYPQSEVYYKTPNYEMDKEVLADCKDVIVSSLQFKQYKNPVRRFIAKANRYLRKKLGWLSKPEKCLNIETDWINDCDVLIIVGGDVFNLLPSQEKPHSYYSNDRILLSMLAKNRGAKVYVWGLSAGPFESNPQAKKKIINYFNHYPDKIIVRENETYKYLKENGVENIVLCSDPAFSVKTVSTRLEFTQKILGVNLSPLANRYLGEEHTEMEWAEIWANIIIRIMNAMSFNKVILLPHVVNKKKLNDDDLAYLQKIYKLLESKGIESEVVDTNPGFIGIKKEIEKCDLVMASRMHCAVNAITCEIPTVFLSYSAKSIGMCNHVYDNEMYVLDMRELIFDQRNEGLYKICSEISNLKVFLSKRSKQLCEDAKSAVSYIQA